MDPNQIKPPVAPLQPRPDVIPPAAQPAALRPLPVMPNVPPPSPVTFTPLPSGNVVSETPNAPDVQVRSRWMWIGGAGGAVVIIGVVVWLLLGPHQTVPTVETPSSDNQNTGSGQTASSNFDPQIGQTRTQVDAAAAADGRLPLCTTSGSGASKTDVCRYTATAVGGKIEVTFVGGVVSAVTKM